MKYPQSLMYGSENKINQNKTKQTNKSQTKTKQKAGV